MSSHSSSQPCLMLRRSKLRRAFQTTAQTPESCWTASEQFRCLQTMKNVKIEVFGGLSWKVKRSKHEKMCSFRTNADSMVREKKEHSSMRRLQSCFLSCWSLRFCLTHDVFLPWSFDDFCAWWVIENRHRFPKGQQLFTLGLREGKKSRHLSDKSCNDIGFDFVYGSLVGVI